jgi:plasmid stabilization system protein ParE
MLYRVRLSERASRDLQGIHSFIAADVSEAASTWFNELADAIYSLERFPGRGVATPENKKLRHLLFGKKPDTYRIIYATDKRAHVVNVIHIRHAARAKRFVK